MTPNGKKMSVSRLGTEARAVDRDPTGSLACGGLVRARAPFNLRREAPPPRSLRRDCLVFVYCDCTVS